MSTVEIQEILERNFEACFPYNTLTYFSSNYSNCETHLFVSFRRLNALSKLHGSKTVVSYTLHAGNF